MKVDAEKPVPSREFDSCFPSFDAFELCILSFDGVLSVLNFARNSFFVVVILVSFFLYNLMIIIQKLGL